MMRAVTIQTDGKIVLLGTANSKFAAVRLHGNGSLDTSFGDDGKVNNLNFHGAGSHAWAGALQSDGKIVLAGQAFVPGIGGDDHFAVARLRGDGSLDPSFGWLTFNFPGMSRSVATAVTSEQRQDRPGRLHRRCRRESFRGGAAERRWHPDPPSATMACSPSKLVPSRLLGRHDRAGRRQDRPGGLNAVMRLNGDGSFDTSFSDDGKRPSAWRGGRCPSERRQDRLAGSIGATVERTSRWRG
jgi:uncharacterized delta-60 repeat protein